MIISVGTGNKQMKTENCEFNSGVEILDTLPGELEEVIEYEGNIIGQLIEEFRIWSFLYNKKRGC